MLFVTNFELTHRTKDLAYAQEEYVRKVSLVQALWKGRQFRRYQARMRKAWVSVPGEIWDLIYQLKAFYESAELLEPALEVVLALHRSVSMQAMCGSDVYSTIQRSERTAKENKAREEFLRKCGFPSDAKLVMPEVEREILPALPNWIREHCSPVLEDEDNNGGSILLKMSIPDHLEDDQRNPHWSEWNPCDSQWSSAWEANWAAEMEERLFEQLEPDETMCRGCLRIVEFLRGLEWIIEILRHEPHFVLLVLGYHGTWPGWEFSPAYEAMVEHLDAKETDSSKRHFAKEGMLDEEARNYRYTKSKLPKVWQPVFALATLLDIAFEPRYVADSSDDSVAGLTSNMLNYWRTGWGLAAHEHTSFSSSMLRIRDDDASRVASGETSFTEADYSHLMFKGNTVRHFGEQQPRWTPFSNPNQRDGYSVLDTQEESAFLHFKRELGHIPECVRRHRVADPYGDLYPRYRNKPDTDAESLLYTIPQAHVWYFDLRSSVTRPFCPLTKTTLVFNELSTNPYFKYRDPSVEETPMEWLGKATQRESGHTVRGLENIGDFCRCPGTCTQDEVETDLIKPRRLSDLQAVMEHTSNPFLESFNTPRHWKHPAPNDFFTSTATLSGTAAAYKHVLHDPENRTYQTPIEPPSSVLISAALLQSGKRGTSMCSSPPIWQPVEKVLLVEPTENLRRKRLSHWCQAVSKDAVNERGLIPVKDSKAFDPKAYPCQRSQIRYVMGQLPLALNLFMAVSNEIAQEGQFTGDLNKWIVEDFSSLPAYMPTFRAAFHTHHFRAVLQDLREDGAFLCNVWDNVRNNLKPRKECLDEMFAFETSQRTCWHEHLPGAVFGDYFDWVSLEDHMSWYRREKNAEEMMKNLEEGGEKELFVYS